MASSRWVMDQSELAIKLTFKNRLILKILVISANLIDILDDPNDKYLLDQVQNGYLSWISLTWPSNQYSKIMFRETKGTYSSLLMLKFLGISTNINDILDELDTILDDPYYLYLS